MAKFFRGVLPSVVWDPKKGRPLAEFVDGQFETADRRVIGMLIKKGYTQIDEDAEGPPFVPGDEDLADKADNRYLDQDVPLIDTSPEEYITEESSGDVREGSDGAKDKEAEVPVASSPARKRKKGAKISPPKIRP